MEAHRGIYMCMGHKGVYMSIGVKEKIEVYIQGSFGAYMAIGVYGGIHGHRGIYGSVYAGWIGA